MFVWIDMEMTGLDHRVHRIVEIATVITDARLENVVEGPSMVIAVSEEDLARMPPVVAEMHSKSGLLEEIKQSKISLAEAEQRTMEFIRANVPKPAEAPICGNSIGTDRRFLDEYMPKIEQLLHYRVVDVSSFRMVAEVLAPEVVKKWHSRDEVRGRGDANTDASTDDGAGSGNSASNPAKEHRALHDIHKSIRELRHYYDHWLPLAGEGGALVLPEFQPKQTR